MCMAYRKSVNVLLKQAIKRYPLYFLSKYIKFFFLILLFISLFILSAYIKNELNIFIHASISKISNTVLATFPRGTAALSAFDQLPFIRTGTTVHQVSSYDRSNGNIDGSSYSMYQDPVTNGYVVMEEYKPGTIYRMWATGLTGGNIMIFFDGATTPAINMPVATFFSGIQAPFLAPLVGGDTTSSGGFYSYYPLSFVKSVKVEFTSVPWYYNFSYDLYSDATGVTTYTGNEDMSAIYNSWNNPTIDPKSTLGNQTVATDSFSLVPGQTQQLANLTGAGSIRSIVMKFPQFITTQYPTQQQVTDSGKAFTGSSSFMVKIDPNNQGVLLTRRFDYGIGDQTANVLVNDKFVGQWSTPGSDQITNWRDSTFTIPQSAIATGSSQMKVTIQFVSSQVDWNEFYYWIKSIGANGEQTVTDTVDIGNLASEIDHQYTISNQTWSGGRTYNYPNQTITTSINPSTIDILSNTRVKIYWDGETTPSVNVPLGFFYGLGTNGEGSVKGLLMGVDPRTHTYYNYFPMPYGKSASIVLVNNSQTKITDATASIQYNPTAFPGLGTTSGYFVANYAVQNPPPTGGDFHWANLSGTGQIVAEMLNLKNFTDTSLLEGDERVFVDQTPYNPQVHGTGTEDFFNGGWYFKYGDWDPLESTCRHASLSIL